MRGPDGGGVGLSSNFNAVDEFVAPRTLEPGDLGQRRDVFLVVPFVEVFVGFRLDKPGDEEKELSRECGRREVGFGDDINHVVDPSVKPSGAGNDVAIPRSRVSDEGLVRLVGSDGRGGQVVKREPGGRQAVGRLVADSSGEARDGETGRAVFIVIPIWREYKGTLCEENKTSLPLNSSSETSGPSSP